MQVLSGCRLGHPISLTSTLFNLGLVRSFGFSFALCLNRRLLSGLRKELHGNHCARYSLLLVSSRFIQCFYLRTLSGLFQSGKNMFHLVCLFASIWVVKLLHFSVCLNVMISNVNLL